MMKRASYHIYLLLLLLPVWSLGQEDTIAHDPDLKFAQVVAIKATRQGQGWMFRVTVRHHDQGWDHYANAWEVVDPHSGKVLATRVLAHPHDQEQPFTRSLGGIRIPQAVGEVVVRARCNQHGFKGKQVKLVRVGTEGKRFEPLP